MARPETQVDIPKLTELEAFPPGATHVSLTPGPDGALWELVQLEPSERRTQHSSGASFVNTRASAPVRYLVRRYGLSGGPPERVLEAESAIHFHFAQPLRNGEVLLAGARCRFNGGKPDRNGCIFRKDGTLLRELVLGDGIADLQTTDDGCIWAGYFDEGVFGNYGWGRDEGQAPLGESGLVSFDSYGHVLSRFDASAAGTDAICDLYALNVVSDAEAWLCFYTDFPLVRLRRGEAPRTWTPDVGAPRALAVSGNHVLAAGGYRADDPWHLVQLRQDGTARSSPWRPRAPGGAALQTAHLFGRGASLFAVHGTEVLRLDLRQYVGE